MATLTLSTTFTFRTCRRSPEVRNGNAAEDEKDCIRYTPTSVQGVQGPDGKLERISHENAIIEQQDRVPGHSDGEGGDDFVGVYTLNITQCSFHHKRKLF